MNLFLIISFIAFLLTVLYAALITSYILDWKKLDKFNSIKNNFSTRISIIIAARNEANSIGSVLNSIEQQDFPMDLVEVLLVDDFSEDDTIHIASEFLNKIKNFRVIALAETNYHLSGKKSAIRTGINQAAGQLIITTDADCVMNSKWLATLVSYYETRKPKMIVAPVIIMSQNGFGQLQQLEFASLMASTAASLSSGKPLMCNGANLVFTREVFFEVDGFENNIHTATGDDTFLMFKISDKHPGSVHFINSVDAVVYTPQQEDLKSFISQRIRWASKTTLYKRNYVLLTGVLIASVNTALLITLIASFYNLNYLLLFSLVFIIKTIFDYVFITPVLSFYKIERAKRWILLLEIVYPAYVLFVAIRSQVSGFNWKGRELN